MVNEPVDLTQYSLTFPGVQGPEIPRDALIGWLRDRFGPDRRVIVVTGPDGSGKTTLLAQFARVHRDRSFSFFIGADRWLSSARQFLLEMLVQMHPIVGASDSEVDDSLSDNDLRRLFSTYYRRAAKMARRAQVRFYIVVDGLDWATRAYAQESILDVLPTDPIEGLYLLASCGPEFKPGFEHYPSEITLFSSTETMAYLRDLCLTEQQIMQVHKACSGMPGYLAQIRMELVSGMPLDDVLRDLPSGFRDLLERQWVRQPVDNKEVLRAMAVLAHGETPLDLEQLAAVVDSAAGELAEGLQGALFLRVTEPGAPLAFVTDAHRRFVRDKLQGMQAAAETMLIEYYEKDPLADAALVELPVLYSRADRYDAMKQLVNVDYLLRMLRRGKDLSVLLRTATLVADLAEKEEDWQTLLRYSLVGSSLRTLATRSVMQTELDALLALGDYKQSMQLAQQAVLPEDRLQTLARIGSQLKRDGLPVPAELRSDLEYLADQAEPAAVSRERILEIAADLFYLHPQAALRLIERAAGAGGGGKLMDVMLAALSIMVGQEPSSADVLRSRIGDQTLRNFARVSSPMVAEMDPDEVLAEARKIEDTSASLFLLRSWCNANRHNAQSILVVDEALQLMTSSTDYSPSMRHLRQFAEPILACAGSDVLRAVERIDLLKDTSIPRPYEEFARLELLLASVEAKLGVGAPTDRLYRVYLELEQLDEWDTRCFVLARLLISLPAIDPSDTKLQEEIQRTLDIEYQTLLDGSADHLALTKRLLGTLTRLDPESAVDFAGRLNLLDRRHLAYREILRVYTDREPEDIDLDFVDDLLERITDPSPRDWTVRRILERFADRDMFARVPRSRSMIEKVPRMRDARDAAYAYAYCCQMMASAGKPDDASHLFNKALEAWRRIDSKWDQVSIGFGLVAVLAPQTEGFARQMLAEAREQRAATPLAENVFAELYIWTIELSIRAFSDILKHPDQEALRTRLVRAIERIPSAEVRCRLLAHLALRHYLAGKQKEFEAIVSTGVLRELDTCKDEDARARAVVQIAPCLFRYERALMADELSTLPAPRKEQALAAVLTHLLSGRCSDDPVDLDGLGAAVPYENAAPACEIIRLMDKDSTIHSYVSRLVDNLVQTAPQRPSTESCTLIEKHALKIASDLATVCMQKLPDPDGIQHAGYVVATQAHIARLRSARRTVTPFRASQQWAEVAPSWEDIAKAARGIPNTADRALVLTWTGAAMYPTEQQLGHQLLNEAETCIHRIPTLLDRANRLSELADAWKRLHDPASAKVLLKEATSILECCRWDDTRDHLTGQILQLAHSLDPEFAGSLTSSIDNPLMRHDYQRGLDAETLRNQPDKVHNYGDSSRHAGVVLGKGARRLLRSFCSGKGSAQSDRVVLRWLRSAMETDFEHARHVAAWCLQNMLWRTEPMQAAALTEAYIGLLDLLDLEWHIGATVLLAEARDRSLQHVNRSLPDGIAMFQAGSGQEALIHLRGWIEKANPAYMVVYDPYFTPAELGILKHVSSDARVDILTSWHAQRLPAGDASVDQRFRNAWATISDPLPSQTRIHIIGTVSSGLGPMKQRFIIADGAGLELGTSISGLGAKDASIRQLGPDEASAIENEFINPLLLGRRTEHQGERLVVRTFSI